MDMSDKNNLELERRGDEQLTYNPPRMSGDWQFNDANFISSSSMGIVSNANVVMGCGDLAGPSYSSGGMVSSLGSSMWEHPLDSVSIGLNDMNVQCGGAIASEIFPVFKSNMFVQSMAGMLPHSLSEFPTDSAFIERAARFSSFSGGHFGELLHPLGVQSVNTYAPGSEKMMHGPQEVLSGTAVKILPCRQPQSRDVNVSETSRDVSLPQDQGAVDGGSPMNKTMPQRSHREAKQGVSLSGNDSDVPEYSGGGSRENMGPSSVKRLGGSKRKRATQDIESDQAKVVQQQPGETRKKQSVSTAKKSNEKQSSQNTDPPKGEYIHVRARRGQATNSHSLAERVRREKISERMKFLQDLVPGCSKVTGKAVMLDEIINYVQSLQRQVEFLSMKLATVHPKLDFNIEQLLAKDHILSVRSCPSGVGSSPGMPTAYPPLHPSQPPILQPGHPSIGDCPDLLRRTVSSQLTNSGEGYKDPDHQLPNAWEDELHNVVQMGFNATDPLTSEDANCPTAQGSMKAEF